MKSFLIGVGLCLSVWTAWADGTPFVPASVADVAAGTNKTKFVTPYTLAQSGIGTGTNGINTNAPLAINNTITGIAVVSPNFQGNGNGLTNLAPATVASTGVQSSNQFMLYSEQYNSHSFQPAPVFASTFSRFGGAPAPGNGGGTLNSNAVLQTLGLNQNGVSDWNNWNLLWAQNYGAGFVYEVDEILTVRSNGVLCINTDPANSGTNFPWTAPQLVALGHTNNTKVIYYFEPNAGGIGNTSNGNPDSEGTNIEFDAMNAALAGCDGARIDPHGWTTLDQVIMASQRFENTFRAYATNRQCYFVMGVGGPLFNGNTPDNLAKLSQALPGTLIRLFPENYGNGSTTNSFYASLMTNFVDKLSSVSGLQHPGQWYCANEFYLSGFGTGGLQPWSDTQMKVYAMFESPRLLAFFDGLVNSQQAFAMTNKEILDIQYDPAYNPVYTVPYVGTYGGVGSSNTFQILTRQYGYGNDGSKVVCMLNRSTNNANTAFFTWTNLGVPYGSQFLVRDAEWGTNFGIYSGGFTNTLNAQSALLLRLYPIDDPKTAYILSQGGSNPNALTNGNVAPASFAGSLSTELGRNPFQAGLLLDVGADNTTNVATVVSRSPLGQVGTSSGAMIWTNSYWGLAFFSASAGGSGSSGIDFGVPTWLPTNAITMDIIFNVTNDSLSFYSATNGLQTTGISINANGFVYWFMNGVQVTFTSQPQLQVGGLGLHEVTATYDMGTSNAVIYVDGLPQISTALTSTTSITNIGTNHVTLFGANNGAGAYDTVLRTRIWGRALTTNEVLALYNQFQPYTVVQAVSKNYALKDNTVGAAGFTATNDVAGVVFGATNYNHGTPDRYVSVTPNSFTMGDSNNVSTLFFPGWLNVFLNRTGVTNEDYPIMKFTDSSGNNSITYNTLNGIAIVGSGTFTGNGSNLTQIPTTAINVQGPYRDIANTNALLVTDGDSLTATNLTSHDSWVNEFATNQALAIPGVSLAISNVAVAGTTISQMITRFPTSTLICFNTNSSSVGTNQYLSLMAGANDLFNTNSWKPTFNLWYQYVTNYYATVPGGKFIGWTVPDSLQYNPQIRSNLYIFNSLLRKELKDGFIAGLHETMKSADMTVTNLNDGDGRHPSQLGDQRWAAGFNQLFSTLFEQSSHWANNTNGDGTFLNGDVMINGNVIDLYNNFANANHKRLRLSVDTTTAYINPYDATDAAAAETTVSVNFNLQNASFFDLAKNDKFNNEMRMFNNGTQTVSMSNTNEWWLNNGFTIGFNSINGNNPLSLLVNSNLTSVNGQFIGNGAGLTNLIMDVACMAATNAQAITGSGATNILVFNYTNYDNNTLISNNQTAFLVKKTGKVRVFCGLSFAAPVGSNGHIQAIITSATGVRNRSKVYVSNGAFTTECDGSWDFSVTNGEAITFGFDNNSASTTTIFANPDVAPTASYTQLSN